VQLTRFFGFHLYTVQHDNSLYFPLQEYTIGTVIMGDPRFQLYRPNIAPEPPYIYMRIVHLFCLLLLRCTRKLHHDCQATRAAKTRRASSASRWACLSAPSCCCSSVALPWLLLRDPSRLLQQLPRHVPLCVHPPGLVPPAMSSLSVTVQSLSGEPSEWGCTRRQCTRRQCCHVALIWKEKKWNLPFVVGLTSGR